MTSEKVPTEQMTELLIMPDGTIYVHNLTPEMAIALSALNPDAPSIRARVPVRGGHAAPQIPPPTSQPLPPL